MKSDKNTHQNVIMGILITFGHFYVSCDINIKYRGLKFVSTLTQLFLNRFWCSGAQKNQKFDGYTLVTSMKQNTHGYTCCPTPNLFGVEHD